MDRYSISYDYRKTYGFGFSTSVNYSNNEPVLTNVYNVNQIYRVVSPIQIGQVNDFYTTKIRMSYIKPYWSLRGNSSYRISKLNNLVNDIAFKTDRNVWDNTLRLITNFKKYPNIDLETSYIRYFNKTGALRNNQDVFSLEASLSKDIVDWKFNIDYEFTVFRNASTNSTSQLAYDNLNTSVFYNKEDSLWSFELKVNNLTGNKEILRASFDTTFINETRHSIFPRTVMLNISYKL